MPIHNMMTCQGMMSTDLITPCSMAWLGAALLFFIIVFTRKGLELANMDFNSLGAFAGAYILYFLIVTITGTAKWGLLGGIVGLLVGGLALGYFTGGDY